MHEVFEHTADLGLRIRSPELDTLFAEAGEALFAAIVEDLATVEAKENVTVRLKGDDRVFLLFDWLNELLYHFDVEHRLFSRFEVRVTAEGLEGSAWGESLDRDRHALAHEVKAITYHGLRVDREEDGWIAEIIVDI